MRIDAALDAFRKESEVAREQIWKLAFALVIVLPLMMLLAWTLTAANIKF